MITKCDVYIWESKLGTLFEIDKQIYFEFDKNCQYNISPFVFEDIDTTRYNFSHLNFNQKLAGVFADSLPDRYGTKIMDKYFMNKRLNPTPIDRLMFIGEDGLGALKYKPSLDDTYNADSLSQISDIKELYNQSKIILRDEIDISTYNRNLIISNASAGGARAKATIMYNPLTNKCTTYNNFSKHENLQDGFVHAIVKFDELGNNTDLKDVDDVKIEYVYSKLARLCDIDMPKTYLTPDDGDGKQHFVIERFDNIAGEPLHLHSLAGLYNHNFEEMLDYDDLFRITHLLDCTADKKEIYKRMVFNYVFKNQDDHTKNFSFLMDQNQQWRFSPAYDLMYNNGKKFTFENRMSFDGKLGSEVTIKEFESLAKTHGIDNYLEIIQTIQDVKNIYLKNLLGEYKVQQNAIDEIVSSCRNIS